MTTGRFRWTHSTILLSALLALTGCAHMGAPRQPPPAEVPVTPAAPAATTVPPSAPDSAAVATSPSSSGPAAGPEGSPDTADATAADSESPAPEPEPVVGISPDDYADLFDRIRAGFRLEDVDRPAVSRQLQWFVDNPDYIQRAFQRSGLYLYYIATQLESRGMPLELALLPVIESAYEPYAYSRARAMGLWQFVPGTAFRFGLKQNWWYDGRRDVVESTRAALDYLQYLHDEFNGDWLLAIAAYNCGEAAVVQAVQSNQSRGRPTDFWSLRLPRETRAYVPKLLAMKRLVSRPESYGLTFSPMPNRPYFVRVDTLGQIDLRVAAEIAGVSSDDLYELNPAFHRWATDPSGPYSLLLPSEAADVFRGNIVQLSTDERMRVEHYDVRRGDSMAGIARHFGTTAQVIRELNDLPSGALVIGTELRVPAELGKLPPKVLQAAALVDARDRHRMLRPRMRVVVHRGDSLWAIARRHGVDVHTLALLNGIQPGDTLHAGQRLMLTSASVSEPPSHGASTPSYSGRRLTYVVRAGDTLYRIARLFQVTVAQIESWNGLAHTALSPGQRLLIRMARE